MVDHFLKLSIPGKSTYAEVTATEYQIISNRETQALMVLD